MAHESFEDEATASLMNVLFINVKVDREERPDLDKTYQKAHHLLTRRTGGWPLTMFLAPDTLLPFFGGTYFPNTPRYGSPSFMDVLQRVSEAYQTRREDLENQGSQLKTLLNQTSLRNDSSKDLSNFDLLRIAREQLEGQYDPRDGGFGEAPKFPQAMSIDRLLRTWAYQQQYHDEVDHEGLEMATHTLTKMARGGIYDHLGGGFCRYSTDRQWMVPHFEKMLYDNALLLGMYVDAHSITGNELFGDVVRETVEWITRDMQHENGGYFSAIDADSEGEEGKYYVWRRDQVQGLLTKDEYSVIETLYGLDKPANFESQWNLARQDAWLSVVRRLSLQREEAETLLASAKAKLFAERSKRVLPALDNKILTAWNGLAIKSMAKASVAMGEPSWLASAQRAADFVRENCFDGSRLFATWCEGRTQYAGYLDDYANMLDALLTLLSAQWRRTDIETALAVADTLIEQFFDIEHQCFYFTANDQEALIHRPKPTMDDALPSGNGVAAQALIQLTELTGELRFRDIAEKTLASVRGDIQVYPSAFCTMLSALESLEYAPQHVIIRGQEIASQRWLCIAQEGYHPWRTAFAIPDHSPGLVPPYLPRLVPLNVQDQVTAYICTDLMCSAPITSVEEFRKQLT